MDSLICRSLPPSCGMFSKQIALCAGPFSRKLPEVHQAGLQRSGSVSAAKWLEQGRTSVFPAAPSPARAQISARTAGPRHNASGMWTDAGVCFRVSRCFLSGNQQPPTRRISVSLNLTSIGPSFASHRYQERGKGGSEGFRGLGWPETNPEQFQK